MLYDQFGRLIPEERAETPKSGMQILMQPLTDRESRDVSRGLTPRDVDRILLQANGGDVEAQCRLSRELPEKNAAVAHALRTRRNAVSGCEWHVEPGDDTPAAQAAAEALEKELDRTGAIHPGLGRVGSFSRLLRDLTDAILPGFACAEILWRPGGRGFYGFRPVEQRFFSFAKSYAPRLRTRGHLYEGEELPRGKIIYHELGDNGSDPVRGGLIRPLAWLHCFTQLNLKDLLSFIERYGMPFVRATVDQGTWDKEKVTLNDLISNFGPRGGGVFSHGVEVELLQAASTTGDVYFRLLQYMDDAITKVLLGQTASSGDSAGLSGGDAQSKVRQDILEADARALEDTVNRDLFALWTEYNCAPGTPAPLLKISTEPPEDKTALAATLTALYNAGMELDPEELSEKFSVKLRKREMESTGQFGQFGQFGTGVEGLARGATENGGALTPDKEAVMYGALIRAGVLTPTRDLEERIRGKLGLEPLPEEAQKLWSESGGVRKPLTIKDPAEQPPDGTGNMELSDKLDKPDGGGSLSEALEEMFGPFADTADRIVETLDNETLTEEERKKRLREIELKTGNVSGMEKLMSGNMEKQYALGKDQG